MYYHVQDLPIANIQDKPNQLFYKYNNIIYHVVTAAKSD